MTVEAKKTTDYRKAEVWGKKALFSNFRPDLETLPAGVVAYDLREGEPGDEHNEFGEPCPPSVSIAKNVLVNHFGTILVLEKIEAVEVEERMLEEDDWGFFDDEVSLRDGILWLAGPNQDLQF